MASVVSEDDTSGKGEILSITEDSMSGAGGLNAEMKRIKVEFSSGNVSTYVLKTTGEGRAELGLAREAHFYKCADIISSFGIPKVYFSSGDMKTGAKQILLKGTAELNFMKLCVIFITSSSITSNACRSERLYSIRVFLWKLKSTQSWERFAIDYCPSFRYSQL